MNLYVGNLDFNTTKERLHTMFAKYGTVEEISIVTDRLTDQYRSFGSVTMQNDGEAEDAMRAINGRIVGGRRIVVIESPPSAHQSRKGNNSEVRWWRRHI
jgi:RNA recognition motif-containing protein